MTYEELIKVGRRLGNFGYNTKIVEYYYKGMHYLVLDNKIICQAQGVRLRPNGDYTYIENKCCVLVRDERVIYKTPPGQFLIPSSADPHNEKYTLCDNEYRTIEELSFPFKTSILDVIDNKLKGIL